MKSDLVIRRIRKGELALCAGMMAASEPWITLGRKREQLLHSFQTLDREKYAARMDGQLSGVLVLCMTGAFAGYIQALCVAPEFRGRGIGTRLLDFAEKRIFRDSPNVFLLVSSFNTGAQKLYSRLGYERAGEFPNYVVEGYSEILMRKTIGPLSTFRKHR